MPAPRSMGKWGGLSLAAVDRLGMGVPRDQARLLSWPHGAHPISSGLGVHTSPVRAVMGRRSPGQPCPARQFSGQIRAPGQCQRGPEGLQVPCLHF